MSLVKKYFNENRYKPKFFIGDRVTGKFHKIPFCGTVANDSEISIEEGPRIQVFLDLPLKYKDVFYTFITVKHHDVKFLK